jgi:peptidoglycan/xylan/chitin deacetylase (PgdA/CDA1 family)
MPLAILNYHNVAVPPAGVRMPELYVTPEQFARQLWCLRRAGLVGVSLSEGARRLDQGDSRGCVAITFDDGYADNWLNAAPALREFGFTATCFVVADQIGGYNVWDADVVGAKKPLMSRSQLMAWCDAGLEVGSHTRSHCDLTTLAQGSLMEELISSRSILQGLTGSVVRSFCYPWGRYNLDVLGCVAHTGYQLAVTTQRGRAQDYDDLLRLPRISVNGGKGLMKFLLKAGTGYCDFGRFLKGH